MSGFIDHQALDLVEHGRVRLIGIAPVGAARHDDAMRRRLAPHGANLHRRGVGAEQAPLAIRVRGKVEGVHHLARRMLGRNVEGGEVVEIVLDVGALDHREAHIGEDRRDFVEHLAHRVDAPFMLRPDRQRDIDGLLAEPILERHGREIALAVLDGCAHAVLDRVEGAGALFALLARNLAQAAHQLGELALAAERGDARRLETLEIAGRGDGAEELPFQLVKFLHRSCAPRATKKGATQAAPCTISQDRGPCQTASPNAWRASLARLLKASGSRTARSARILRSTSTPASLRPFINRP